MRLRKLNTPIHMCNKIAAKYLNDFELPQTSVEQLCELLKGKELQTTVKKKESLDSEVSG